MRSKIRVLLIENQILTRIGVNAVLSAQNDIEIIGTTSSKASPRSPFLIRSS